MTMTRAMRRVLALLLVIAGAFVIFALWPGLDLRVTAMFHDSASGFSAADSGWPNALRLAVWQMSEAMLLMSVGATLYGYFAKSDAFGLSRRTWGFMLGLYAIGPGLMVDVVLKPLWGRARPANILEFGGKLDFTPPYQIADECARNCSFVSGEVSGAVALAICLMLILVRLRDRIDRLPYQITMVVVLALPIVTALQRIAAGRHFLSDAIFAALFTLLVAALLDAAFGAKGWLARLSGRR